MHKSKKILLALLCSFLFIGGANAECDYETEVNMAKEASNVKVNYEAKKVIIDYRTGEVASGVTEDDVNNDDSFYVYANKAYVTIYNVTKNMNITITGDNGFSNKIAYADTSDGTYTFDGGNLEEIVNYEIKVTTNNPSCSGKEFRSLNLLTPKINEYHYYAMCDGVDEYYCQEFIDFDLNMSEEEIFSKALSKRDSESIQADESKENKSWVDNVKEYLKDKGWIIYTGIGVVILLAGVATAVIIIKRRRSRVL